MQLGVSAGVECKLGRVAWHDFRSVVSAYSMGGATSALLFCCCWWGYPRVNGICLQLSAISAIMAMEAKLPFILAIVGSRKFADYGHLCCILRQVQTRIDGIVSGGAPGADTLAEHYAHEHNIPMIVHRAEWDRYGKSAGLRRNARIVADADAMIAFLAPESKGTRNSIKLAEQKGIPVHIINC